MRRLITWASERVAAGKRLSFDDLPMRKPWMLLKDGDLWRLAWRAIVTRGHRAQKFTKVKGHATAKEIDEGVATEETKFGNDCSDDMATKGIEEHGLFTTALRTLSVYSICIPRVATPAPGEHFG